MTVKEMIEILRQFPEDLPVAETEDIFSYRMVDDFSPTIDTITEKIWDNEKKKFVRVETKALFI